MMKEGGGMRDEEVGQGVRREGGANLSK